MSHDWMQNDQDPTYPQTKSDYGIYNQTSIDGPWVLVRTGSQEECKQWVTQELAKRPEIGQPTYINGGKYNVRKVYIIPGHRGSTALQLVGAKENNEPRWKRNQQNWEPFLEKYKTAIEKREKSTGTPCEVENILLSLLTTNCKYIPFDVTHPRFQTNFRQCDITPDADMAIWYAIRYSNIFWDLVQEETQKEHEIAYAMNTKKGDK